MKRPLIAMLTFSLSSVVALGAADAQMINFINGWKIERAQPSGVCLMTASFSSMGLTLAFGRSASRPGEVRVILAGQSWQALTRDQSYPVEVTFGRTSQTGSAVAVETPVGKALTFGMSERDYFKMFDGMTGSFRIAYGGKTLISYSPEGKDILAVAEVSRCLQGSVDPFAR